MPKNVCRLSVTTFNRETSMSGGSFRRDADGVIVGEAPIVLVQECAKDVPSTDQPYGHESVAELCGSQVREQLALTHAEWSFTFFGSNPLPATGLLECSRRGTGAGCLVTGGASGIGLALARTLLQGGARVVLVDISSRTGQVVEHELQVGCPTLETDPIGPAYIRAVMLCIIAGRIWRGSCTFHLL